MQGYGRWIVVDGCHQLRARQWIQRNLAIKAVVHTWHSAQQWRNRTRAVHERVESLHLGALQAEAARHRDWTRVPTDVYTQFFLALTLASPFFLYFFQRFWDRTSPQSEIGLHYIRCHKNGVGDVRSQKKVKPPKKYSGNSGPTLAARSWLRDQSPSACRAPVMAGSESTIADITRFKLISLL